MKRKLEEIFCRDPEKRVKLEEDFFQQGIRVDSSVWSLTRKFLEVITDTPNMEIDIKDAANKLQAQKRRINDIANVLEGIGYLEKIGRNRVKWVSVDEELDHELKIIQREIEEIDEEEKTVQVLLEFMKQNSMHQLNQTKFLHLKFGDLKQNEEKKQCIPFLIVTAPKGTIVEAPIEINSSFPYQLHFDSSRVNGNGIGVFVLSCSKNPVEFYKQNEMD